VAGGIERLPHRRVAREAVLLEHAEQLALDQLDAFDDRGGPGGAAAGGQGAVEIVEHREQVADQRLGGVLEVLLTVALGPTPHVVGLGQRAQELVLPVLHLAAEVLDLRLERAGGITFGFVGGAIVHRSEV